MTEPTKRCGRCGEPIEEFRARVAIESGPLHATHPVLELCDYCSESLERWLARRGRGRHGSSGPHSHSHSHSHRHGAYDDPALFSAPPSQVVLSLPGDAGRQILLLAVILAALGIGMFLLASLMR